MLDSNLEDMLKCLDKMKRKINKIWFLLGAVSIASTPILVSSCVYENHPSVVFAKKYVNSNYWKNNKNNIDKKIAQELQIPEIKNFYDEMIKNIKLEATFGSYDVITPNKPIEINTTRMSEEKIQSLLSSIDSVVKATLENTPFYAFYQLEKDSILKVELNKIVFNYKKVEPSFNYILGSDFVHFLESYEKISDRSIENVYKNLIFDFAKSKPYSFAEFDKYYNEYTNKMESSYSIIKGFGPIFILNNTDKIGETNDNTKVFAEELANSPELAEEFMLSPDVFVEEHPELLYYDSYHGEISKVKNNKSLHTKEKSDRMIRDTLNEIEELSKISSSYRELKAENKSEEAKKVKDEMLNYINNSQYLKKSYDKRVQYVKEKKSETISNIYHYVEFYAVSLFLLGYENIELVSLDWPENTEYNEFNKTNLRYFVIKIKDSKGQTKYLDPYRDYMNYFQDKQYDFGQVYDNIPEGFTISSGFK